MPILVLSFSLLLCGVVLARVDDSDQHKAKLEANPFQGQWILTAYKINGDEAPETILKNVEVTPVFSTYPKTGKKVWEYEDTFEARIAWGKPGDPQSFEMLTKLGDETVRLKGISRVAGDTLQLCFSPTGVAPTAFESKSESSNRLLHLKHAKGPIGPKTAKP